MQRLVRSIIPRWSGTFRRHGWSGVASSYRPNALTRRVLGGSEAGAMTVKRTTISVVRSGLLHCRGGVEPTEGALGCECAVPKQAALRMVLVCWVVDDHRRCCLERAERWVALGIGRPRATSAGDRERQSWWQSVRPSQSKTQRVGGTGESPSSRRLYTVKLSRQKAASFEGAAGGANPLLAP